MSLYRGAISFVVLTLCISLDFLYDETESYYSHMGQPSVDPVMSFKTMLLGYLFDISSEMENEFSPFYSLISNVKMTPLATTPKF